MKTLLLISLFFTSLVSLSGKDQGDKQDNDYDVVVYGGTSAGIIAAVQAAKMGKTVVLIVPDGHLGGLTTGGLGQTDIGNKQVIGGLARQFYERIAKKYNRPEAWKWQKKSDYRSHGQSLTEKGESTMWTFEPSVALEVYRDLIRENNIPVVMNERLDLKKRCVVKKNGAIRRILMESGKTFSGGMFIDASYEGDLMARSGVSYFVGREGEEVYHEPLNGVRTRQAIHHQFPDGIDPYRKKGNPESGLLSGINTTAGEEGSGDHKVQAYCFRMCLTDVPENRIPFEKPADYDEQQYALLFRLIEKGYYGPFCTFSAMPNRKTDSNNNGPFSTDFIGQNYAYPDGDYETREKILRAHETYQKGLMWTLANHPRVPDSIRRVFSRWGLPKDEFTDNGHWPDQLYVREARRMIGTLVMTQHHCTQDSTVSRSVGMGAYTMDSHNIQRYVNGKGWVKNEGDVQVGGFGPYPIGYGAIIPKKEECTNLLVPVCLSASHIAYGSIRMEPVFMILGQSAATAACLALDSHTSVQDIDYDRLKEQLLKDKQILYTRK